MQQRVQLAAGAVLDPARRLAAVTHQDQVPSSALGERRHEWPLLPAIFLERPRSALRGRSSISGALRSPRSLAPYHAADVSRAFISGSRRELPRPILPNVSPLSRPTSRWRREPSELRKSG